MTTTLAQNKPSQKLLVIDLVRSAGVDVSDWSNYEGGEAKAAANPKYCYEWAFVQPHKVVVLNLWYNDLKQDGRKVYLPINLRERAQRAEREGYASIIKVRNLRMDDAIQTALKESLPVRIILLDGVRAPGATRVTKRSLDTEPWSVTRYDFKSGDCVLTRGSFKASMSPDEEELAAFEGELRSMYKRHRKREGKFRARKIAAALGANQGRLLCEVPGCGFDFFEKYGELGAGFAHVHHDKPLSSAPPEGMKIKLSDLKVVCANCHAMIHRGGECRPLIGLIHASQKATAT